MCIYIYMIIYIYDYIYRTKQFSHVELQYIAVINVHSGDIW